MENALKLSIPLEQKNALAIFTAGNVDKIVGEIEGQVRGIVCDVSTAKGRNEIASLAYKVSKSKTALDALGKDLVGDWKSKAKAVDTERKLIRDRLDALRDEVRQPLTEWEEAEKARVERERLNKEIEKAHDMALIENELFDMKKENERKEEEQRQAEMKRLEEERIVVEARLKAEREERIRQQAAEAARAEAEQRAIEERKAAEQKIIDAKIEEEKAKREVVEAEARRVRELKEQEERLRAEQEQQEAERIRKEEEARAVEARKAANRKHQASVNNGILQSLVAIGISEEHAKLLISKTAKGEIENLRITY